MQALYQLEVGGGDIVAVVTEFEAHRLGKEIDGVEYRQADSAWFRDIVAGVVGEQRRLDPLIHDALVKDWPLKRIDATLRAILRAGSYELTKRPDVPGRVIITEYIDIARAFYVEDERSSSTACWTPSPSGAPRRVRAGGRQAVTTAERPGEFDLIARVFAPLAGEGSYGLRDDAASITPPPGHDLVLTVDALGSGVHFFPEDPGTRWRRRPCA